jgi:hypothetical protein
MPDRSSRPADSNQLGKLIVDIATGESESLLMPPKSVKNPAAVALGRLGGAKGGKARAAKLSPEERSATAAKAAAVRWNHDR